MNAGGTTVAAGTLLVNGQVGTDSGTGTGPVVVSAGGTLGGTGRAAGAVTLRGRLQGGDGATAAGSPALTTGAVTFEAGSRLRVAVAGSAGGTAVHTRPGTAASSGRLPTVLIDGDRAERRTRPPTGTAAVVTAAPIPPTIAATGCGTTSPAAATVTPTATATNRPGGTAVVGVRTAVVSWGRRRRTSASSRRVPAAPD